MSARNTLEAKRGRRNRKLFRRELPAYLNLIDWLQDHRYAQTAGGARTLIRNKRVKSESHVVGLVKATNARGDQLEFVQPHVPASMRATLCVELPK